MVSADIKQHWTKCRDSRAQEVCESQSGCPGLQIPNRPYALCGCKATLNLNLKSGHRRVGGLLSEWSILSRSTLLTLHSLLTPNSLLTLWAVQCPHSVIYHSNHFICVTFPAVQCLTSSLLHQHSCEINCFSVLFCLLIFYYYFMIIWLRMLPYCISSNSSAGPLNRNLWFCFQISAYFTFSNPFWNKAKATWSTH